MYNFISRISSIILIKHIANIFIPAEIEHVCVLVGGCMQVHKRAEYETAKSTEHNGSLIHRF